MAKRIILLLDGTWNDADVGPCDTNIVRLREIIGRSLDGSSRIAPSNSPAAEDSTVQRVSGRTYLGQTEHIVFYERGVGTGPLLDRIKGGSFGDGLSGNIRRAYKFLSFYYEPGDQIFVFGFSRGAYTARSLVGYIGSAGLLTRGNCTPVLERKAWDYYRTDPNDRMPGIWAELTPLVHDRGAFRIACLGVFDTVGALGVPLPQFYRLNRESYEFHNVELSSITNVNLHALAVDEHRQPFAPTVWRKPKFKSFATATEQVWFAGSHADIGGGYIEEVRRAETNIKALDDITLDWMLKRVAHHFDGFPFNEQVWKLLDSSWSSAPQHPSRTGFYKLMPLALRAIANRSLAAFGWREKIVGFDRHAESIGEMIHISVLERLGVVVDGQNAYAPYSLKAMLDVIQSSYDKDGKTTSPIKIVNWDGSALDPDLSDDASAAKKLIAEAKQKISKLEETSR
jgi:type VI secretion system (T6SS) phospholipase Tle1-like effector